MAVINTVNDRFAHPQAAAEFSGARVLRQSIEIAMAAADDNDSIYFVGEFPGTAVIDSITIEGATIAGATDVDLGIYEVDGTVIDKDVLADGMDLSDSTGLPTGPYGDPIRYAMTALAPTDRNKKLYELAGHVNKPFPASGETLKRSRYRLALHANAAASAAGTIVVTVDYREYN